jgi:DNA-binding LacI/PurR family transcriptional regulator
MDIREFSKLVGVSTATVSRAFSGRGRINLNTRQNVLEAARKHGFAPNIHAQRLHSKQSGVIGVLYSFSAEPIFDYYNMELATEIAQAASRVGYATQLELTDEPRIKNQHVSSLVDGKGVDGLILVADSEESAREFLGSAPKCPCVVISTQLWAKCAATGLVHIDFRTGIGQALETLIADGHRRIGFMRGFSEETKAQAYLEVMKRHGLPMRPEWICDGPKTYEDGANGMQGLLKSNVTAVLCSTDILALGAMHAAIEKGLRIPEDVSVVGIDNLAFTPFTTPALSSIGVSRREIGQAALELLTRAIRENGDSEKPVRKRPHVQTVSTEFIPRKSSGKFAGARVGRMGANL